MGKASSEGKPPRARHPRDITFPHRGLTCCMLCGALVSSEDMEEHLKGDELMLRIIHHNNPDWTPKECLDYYVRTYRPGTVMQL